MVEPITTTLASLKGAYEGTKTLLKLGVNAAIQKQVFELQAQILAAQESALAANATQTDLLKEIGTLEAKVASFESWEAEAERYELQKLPPGIYVRALKKDAMQPGEPEHHLCTACFEDRKKASCTSPRLVEAGPGWNAGRAENTF